MPIQFVTGDLSQNKKSVLIQAIMEQLKQTPDLQVYYIVPEHLKFEMEKFVLEEIRNHQSNQASSIFNLQVASFSRLNWFLMKDQKPSHEISDLGLSMIVRQVLNQHREKLVVYQKQAHYQGFIEELVLLFKEFIEGNIQVADLEVEQAQDSPLMDLEIEKQKELQMLYQAFLQALSDFRIDNFAKQEDLLNYISQQKLDKHLFVIDHYYYFNSREMQLLLSLAKDACKLKIVLPIKANELRAIQALMTTALPYATYYRIRSLAQQMELELEPDWEIKDQSFNYQPAILNLAHAFKDQQDLIVSAKEHRAGIDANHHRFLQFDSIHSELRYVSNRIHYLVSQKGYRYKDIQVYTRDLEVYQSMIAPILSANQIPYFFDHAKAMTDHPLFTLIQHLIRLDRYNWRLIDILEVLKSPLVRIRLFHPAFEPLSEVDLDRLIYSFENYLIAYQYEGYRFANLTYDWLFMTEEVAFQSADGQNYEFTLAQAIGWIRKYLVEHFAFSKQAIRRNDKQGLAALFYQKLETIGVRQALMDQRDQAIEKGEIEQSRQDEQVWQVLVNSLDEYHQIYGQADLDLATFFEILEAGLSAATYHIIPPTLDQVMISNILSPQVRPCKIAFVIGMDQKALPAKHAAEGLLTPSHRQAINQELLAHQYLADQEQQGYQMEYLLAYQVLLLATDQMVISYATNQGDQVRNFSPWLQQALNLAGLKLIHQADYSMDASLETPLTLADLGRYDSNKSPILYQIHQDFMSGRNPRPVFLKLLQLMVDYEKQHQGILKGNGMVDLIIQTFYFNDLPDKIDSDLALELFGRNLSLSVSRIEQFFADPYSHFLRYGLRLKERDRFELDAALSGDYFHQALDKLNQVIQDRRKSLADLSEEEVKDLLGGVIAQLNQEPNYQVLSRHPRMQAIHHLLNQRLFYFVQLMQEQNKLTHYQPLASELVFGTGSNNQVAGFEYPLASGGRLTIRGKIDRLDQIQMGQQQLLQVIDYKSGKKDFDLVDAYYGLDLQLLTYLAVAMKNYSNHQALGAFYQHLLPNFYKADKNYVDGETDQQSKKLLSQRSLKGFVTIEADDLQTVESFDHQDRKSRIYPVTYTKSGYDSRSPFFAKEDIDLLLDYTHHQFQQAAQAIQSGDIALAPFYENPYTLSLNAHYRVITGFDGTQSFQRYRHKQVNKKDVLAHIKEKLANEERTKGGDSHGILTD
ncbi:PD-(D/E)XK nuclease family protein [Facklamia sp. 7083-14-GEN3]|uniref:PD-(D/E)XK nuclease family protein n=1 Tax=Facklamia sp. 7083-14-GEN3 TaxID=2973478 RepID=UPI00215C10A6|nr:PD-(D/E)XK nuclease family protein [Facklamia sp. 7083-14-GEN3]MCR8968945.1 PD-(D/E)XK nuclease family protein [Facklamia sp. 7083-14-GEN3]